MKSDNNKVNLTTNLKDCQIELNEKYKDVLYPKFVPDENCYAVNTCFGVELGDAEWITSCFILDAPYYNFESKKRNDNSSVHAHNFKDIIVFLLNDPESFDIVGFEEDYTEQQITFISKLRQLILEHYPQYRYTYQSDNDKQLKVVNEFNDVLEAIIENPEKFNINGFKNDYSLQQRAIINNLQNSIIVAKKHKNILSKGELIKKREHFHLFEKLRKNKNN